MKTLNSLVLAKSIAAIAALGFVAGTANAAFLNFDHDPANLDTARASLVHASVVWGKETSGGAYRGALRGQLFYKAGVPGCAKVVMKWMNSVGNTISVDVSPEACSPTGVLPVAVPVNEVFSSDRLSSARLEVHTRVLNGGYTEAGHRFIRMGD